MLEKGFSPKYKTKEEWPVQDTMKLLNACTQLMQDKLAPSQHNWYYFIASEIFQNSKSAKQVEAKINQLIRSKTFKLA